MSPICDSQLSVHVDASDHRCIIQTGINTRGIYSQMEIVIYGIIEQGILVAVVIAPSKRSLDNIHSTLTSLDI